MDALTNARRVIMLNVALGLVAPTPLRYATLALGRPCVAHAQLDDDEVDGSSELWEFDGGMDVADLLASLGDDDGDLGDLGDLGSLLQAEPSSSEDAPPLLIEDEDWLLPPSALPLLPIDAVAGAVREEGVARTRALSEETAAALRADVLRQLEVAQAGGGLHHAGEPSASFSSVLSDVDRCDLRIEISPALDCLLRASSGLP